MYKKTVLKNGIRIVSHPMADRQSASLGFLVGVGGRYENEAIKGAAHFLEHIVFKGSQKYSCEEIKETIEGVGGSLNAFTSEEETCYYAKIPQKFLDQTFDVLADMVFFPKITDEDVKKESSVIIEEIKMYHDLPQYYVMELMDSLLWPGHPLGSSLIGSRQTIEAMSHQGLRNFHQRFYSPSNIVISACGQVNHDKIVKLAQKKLGTFSGKKKEGFLGAKNTKKASRVDFFKKETEQMHMVLGTLGYDEYHKDRYALTLLSVILGGNMSSRLFVEVREKRGLAYSISSSYKAMQDTGQFLIRAGVDPNKVVETVELIVSELEKIRSKEVDLGEFTRAKDYILGQLLLGLEDTMEHMLWIGEHIISKNKFQQVKDVIEKFKKISPKDVKRVAEDILRSQFLNLAVVGPLDENKRKQLMKVIVK